MSTELWKAIASANAALEAGEPGNITDPDHNDDVGYRAQALVDAMNEFVGPENWMYVAGDPEVTERPRKGGGTTQVITVQVTLSVRVNGEWMAKAPRMGDGTGERGLAAGINGAITCGLKKCLGDWSIGNRAYLGLLHGTTKTKSTGYQQRQSSSQSRPPAGNAASPQHAATKPAAPADDERAEALRTITRLLKSLGYLTGDNHYTAAFATLLHEKNLPAESVRTWSIEHLTALKGVLEAQAAEVGVA